MTDQTENSSFPWKIYRDSRGWPRWWQRWYEAWLVVSGRYSFWHAYDQGKNRGAMDEYRRVVVNGGDLVPVVDAAIYATCAAITGGSEPMADKMQELRRAARVRYERDAGQMIAAMRLHQELASDSPYAHEHGTPAALQ